MTPAVTPLKSVQVKEICNLDLGLSAKSYQESYDKCLINVWSADRTT